MKASPIHRGAFFIPIFDTHYCCKTAKHLHEKESNEQLQQVCTQEEQRGHQRTVQTGKKKVEERKGRFF